MLHVMHPLEKAHSAIERHAQVLWVVLHVRMYPCSALIGWKKQIYVNSCLFSRRIVNAETIHHLLFYQVEPWSIKPFGHNRYGPKIGGCAPLGEEAGSPFNTMWPGPRPTSMPSFILIHPTVWPQYTNVADRTEANRFTNGRTKTD